MVVVLGRRAVPVDEVQRAGELAEGEPAVAVLAAGAEVPVR